MHDRMKKALHAITRDLQLAAIKLRLDAKYDGDEYAKLALSCELAIQAIEILCDMNLKYDEMMRQILERIEAAATLTNKPNKKKS